MRLSFFERRKDMDLVIREAVEPSQVDLVETTLMGRLLK